MKKLLCTGLALLLFVSCSDDDSNKTNPVTAKGSNFTATQTQYDDITGKVEGINVSKFTNGLPDVFTSYSPDNKLEGTNKFVYDSDNKVTEITSYNAQNVLAGNFKYTYDSQGRITKISLVYVNYKSDYTYTYNNDKSITGKLTSSDGYEVTKTWYLNNDNLIYKEVGVSGDSYEIIFNDGNVISGKSDSGYTKTFEYDSEHDPSLMGTLPIYGNYKPNFVLQSFYLQDSETNQSTNYVIRELNNNKVSKQYNQEFDSNGRVTKRTTISEGKTISITTNKFE